MKKKKTVTFHKGGGAVIRLPNRRIEMIEDKVGIKLNIIQRTDDDRSTCRHTRIKNKIDLTEIKISHESMMHISEVYLMMQENKDNNPKS